ncbi:iron-binding CDGSH zinc finger protein [Tamilnaduibacter salinus]|uniref:Glutamate synthase n=1 Tax=Tamilnaduibacter salinus TaxID=1484056 RepID=A0A2A2I2E1_9GAMM|nr:CDGSH iron-sulfur domain-containing protein [Tamilnaduibacter salinus]PAV25305.1 glutamate synthase [Tamilnaduibacter salinus]PVY77612.1 iron-binding CDGSH zinc finger protein [Tamilnaduibacter salinus]
MTTEEVQPEMPRKTPCAVAVEAGQRYVWCACGRSESQPFCDGSHKGTSFAPVPFQAERTEWIWFCGCKRTGDPPLCDGTHKTL